MLYDYLGDPLPAFVPTFCMCNCCEMPLLQQENKEFSEHVIYHSLSYVSLISHCQFVSQVPDNDTKLAVKTKFQVAKLQNGIAL